SDVEPDALALVQRNARRVLGHRLATLRVDVADPPEALWEAGPFDLVLCADALYAPPLPEALAALLDRVVAPDGRALVAYPWAGQGEELCALLDPARLRCRLESLEAPAPSPSRTVHLARLGRPRDVGPRA